MTRAKFLNAKRIVVKIGSALLTADGKGLNKLAIAEWVKQIATLKQQGKEVVLVSSGAVAEGMARLNLNKRPKTLHELQATAAVGQMGLIRTFENKFQKHGLHTAQVLLTHDDLSNRQRYLNARSTLLALLNYDVIPVVNENDTVATDEIRFGDNDTLAALVVNLVEADLLIILTDQLGLFDADPSVSSTAKLIEESDVDAPLLETVAGGSHSHLGCGGMLTKVKAARVASRSGAATVIVSGSIKNIIELVLEGQNVGTYLKPTLAPLAARKQWLAAQLKVTGALVLDQKAIEALTKKGKSLLAIGVTAASGNFNRGDLVACVDSKGGEISRGLINYDALETRMIIGKKSTEFQRLLGYVDDEELIHRNNMLVNPISKRITRLEIDV
jgi:glutamate 5-kinase